MQKLKDKRTKFAKLFYEKGLEMQNYLTTGTKSDNFLNFINSKGLKVKTDLTSGTKCDKNWNFCLTRNGLNKSRDQNWLFLNLFKTNSNIKTNCKLIKTRGTKLY